MCLKISPRRVSVVLSLTSPKEGAGNDRLKGLGRYTSEQERTSEHCSPSEPRFKPVAGLRHETIFFFRNTVFGIGNVEIGGWVHLQEGVNTVNTVESKVRYAGHGFVIGAQYCIGYV